MSWRRVPRPDTVVTGLPEEGHTDAPLHHRPRGQPLRQQRVEHQRLPGGGPEARVAGERPCKELATRAGIWRFSATKTGQRFSAAARYATGIRNAGSLAVNPVDGSLYATQHGRDQLAENWPKLFDWKQSAELPAEELLLVVKGGDYGWPYCYYDPEPRSWCWRRNTAATASRWVSAARSSVRQRRSRPTGHPTAWPSTVPNRFPSRTVAAHSSPSMARGTAPRSRRRGTTSCSSRSPAASRPGDYQIFADGFAGTSKQPGTAKHRPSGLAVGPDGALFISDDNGGRVWRVVHGGQ